MGPLCGASGLLCPLPAGSGMCTQPLTQLVNSQRLDSLWGRPGSHVITHIPLTLKNRCTR